MSPRKVTHGCAVENCHKKHVAKGFCSTHYTRFVRYGDPLRVKENLTPIGEAQNYFENVVLTYEGDECLIWPYNRCGNKGKGKRYGQISRGGKPYLVHRLACEEANGPPPTPKHQAAHSCGNGFGGCVTKKHLSWKTSKENHADRRLHGTDNRGERHSMAKLSEMQAREILALKTKESARGLAKRFNISRRTVNQIHAGKIWSHIQ